MNTKKALEIIARIDDNKAKLKIERQLVADTLEGSTPWCKAKQAADDARTKRKQIEQSLIDTPTRERMEALTTEIKNDQGVLQDMALTALMKGESATFENGDDKYEPKIRITFARQLSLGV